MSPEMNGRLGMQLQMCLATVINHQAKPYFADTWQGFSQPWGRGETKEVVLDRAEWQEEAWASLLTHISRVSCSSSLLFLPSS